ncbi:MAG: hypothetical protein U0T81_16665 [Saprospiraceae bacterium]
MKKLNISLICILHIGYMNTQMAFAQTGTREKSTIAQKVSSESHKVSSATQDIKNNMEDASHQITDAYNNMKGVVRIFEPIWRLHTNRKTGSSATGSGLTNTAVQNKQTTEADVQVKETIDQSSANLDTVAAGEVAGSNKIKEEDQLNVNAYYNGDGTANLGSQNNQKYGCFLNVLKAEIMDEIDVAGNSKAVDLIFTSTSAFNEQLPMYAFLTASYAKHDPFAYNYFKGTKYKDRNIPPATWDEVNESEVAMTSLTGMHCEKIKNNDQLMAAVRQLRGFSQKVESRTKLDGKVIALKTEMDQRTVYGLIYIVSHYGTTGESGYLRIKIKVTGQDANGDNIPETEMYYR